eukprot:8223662-Karenia_brevis.AAC.1
MAPATISPELYTTGPRSFGQTAAVYCFLRFSEAISAVAVGPFGLALLCTLMTRSLSCWRR